MYASFLQPVVNICYQKIGLLFSLRVMIDRNQGANFTLVFPLTLSMCLDRKRFWWFSEQWKTEFLKFGSRKKDREEKKNTKNKKPCSFVCPQKQLLSGLIDILLSSFSRIKPQANTPSFLHVKVVITSERNSDIAFRMPRRLSCWSEFILFRSCASEFFHITQPEMPCQHEVTRVSTPEREFHSDTKSRNSIM